MVNPEVWREVPDGHVGETVSPAEKDENADDNGKTKIAEENQLSILGFIQRAGWVEVVDAGKVSILLALTTAFGLTLMIVVAGDIEHKVHWPAEQLLGNGVEESGDWGFFGQFIQFVDHLSDSSGILLPSLRNKDHITLHVSGGLVMLAVGDLPREVGNKEC